KDGRTLTGILVVETATGVTMRAQQGKEETIRRSDLDQLRSTGRSLMPEGLESEIPYQAMADLIANLTAVTPAAKKIPGNEPTEITGKDGSLTLPASRALLFGN